MGPSSLSAIQAGFKTALGRLISASESFKLEKLFVPPVSEAQKQARKAFFESNKSDGKKPKP